MQVLGWLVLPALLVVLGWPLQARKVPPNAIYGIRIPATYRSDEAWYAINAYGGTQFIRAGLITALISAVSAPFGIGVAYPVFLLGVLVTVLATLRYAGRYKRGEVDPAEDPAR